MEGFDQLLACKSWLYDFINKTTLCRTVWISKGIGIFGFFFGEFSFPITAISAPGQA